MDTIDLNKILNRNKIYDDIKSFLINFKNNKHNVLTKRGIYIYGNPGIGKTKFITDLLKKLDFDIIQYDAGDIRNKSILENITKHNMSDKNVLSLMQKKKKELAIVMDEIDGMNNGDKGGINSLIKLIRPKKTKKQKVEESTINPIICIGNYHIDKKINELMKVCLSIELKTPSNNEIENIFNILMPNINDDLKKNLIEKYIQGDLRKLNSIIDINSKHNELLKNNLIQKIFQCKIYNDDSKKITKKILQNKYNLDDHLIILNETDRTIVGLLLHENIIDVLQKNKIDLNEKNNIYTCILDNICYADYMDRITFQKQIWSFNEMSSIIKTIYNNNILHNKIKNVKYNPSEVRFTKILTKYSTEYNNLLFINNLCFQLSVDKKDLFTMFLNLKKKYTEDEIYEILDQYNISKLDINRLYRYLEKYTNKEFVNLENNDDEEINE
jgi:replication factor C subunit 1